MPALAGLLETPIAPFPLQTKVLHAAPVYKNMLGRRPMTPSRLRGRGRHPRALCLRVHFASEQAQEQMHRKLARAVRRRFSGSAAGPREGLSAAGPREGLSAAGPREGLSAAGPREGLSAAGLSWLTAKQRCGSGRRGARTCAAESVSDAPPMSLVHSEAHEGRRARALLLWTGVPTSGARAARSRRRKEAASAALRVCCRPRVPSRKEAARRASTPGPAAPLRTRVSLTRRRIGYLF